MKRIAFLLGMALALPLAAANLLQMLVHAIDVIFVARLGDAALAGKFAEAMLAKGVYVIGFSYPVVPQGRARIRTQISAAHTRQDLEQAINAFAEVKIELGL